MAYTTGSAATTAALIDTILSFAVAQLGATEVHRGVDADDNSYTIICLAKGSSYWWFRVKANTVYHMPCKSGTFTGGSGWSDITDAPLYATLWSPITEPYTSYHLFSEGNVVHAVAEMSNGAYTMLSFGDIVKYDSWTGGAFSESFYGYTQHTSHYNSPTSAFHGHQFPGRASTVFASTGAGRMYLPYNGKDYATFGYSLAGDANFNAIHATGWALDVYNGIISNSPNAFNNRTAGIPVNVFLYDDEPDPVGSDLYVPLGVIPGVRLINIQNLNPKDVINNDWMVFPIQSKNLGLLNSFVNTGNYGWALQQ